MGDDGEMQDKNFILSNKIFKIMGYIFFVVGVIELVTNIISNRYNWLYVVVTGKYFWRNFGK